jgi:hypothetical protein
MTNDEYFTQVFGTRRGSPQRRRESRAEGAVVDVIEVRGRTGGATSTALQGATGLAQSEVEAALKTAETELRVHQNDTTGRWYPGTSTGLSRSPMS